MINHRQKFLWRRVRLWGVGILLSGLISISAAVAEEVSVDLELILAVDVSGSVDWQEAELQRKGYVAALRSKEFIAAIETGYHKKIAVTYIEWAGDGIQTTILEWALIADQQSATKFAEALSKAEIETGPWTSISSVITSSLPLFDNNGYQGRRRVIDISGDGPNNMGEPVTAARDRAIALGVTINGLPILNDRLQPSGRAQIPGLDKYYAACVIGGPRAFLVVAHDFKDFARAIRRKLVFEIADLTPAATSIAVNSSGPLQANYIFRPGCDIGERQLERRRRQYDDNY